MALQRLSVFTERPPKRGVGSMAAHVARQLLFCFILVILCGTTGLLSQRPSPQLTELSADLSWQPIERLIESGKLPEARESLRERVAKSGETYKSFYLEALILFKENQFLESLKKLERSISLEKGDPAVHRLAGLNCVVLERNDAARSFLEAAAELAPNDPMAHYYLGRLYYTIQRFPQAVTELERAVKLDPSFVKGHDNLGLALEAIGNEEAATEAYHKAIELNEQQKLRNEWPYVNLGKFLTTKNRYQESLRLLEKAAQINPKSAEACYVLGKVLNKLGRDAEALEALRHSTLNDPGYDEPHYLLSRIYRKLGNETQAQKEIRIFQELKEAKKKQQTLAR
jgi:tetratricopeptide (TPR) repeat protein